MTVHVEHLNSEQGPAVRTSVPLQAEASAGRTIDSVNAIPHINRWTPPTAEEQAAARAETARMRAEHDAARAAARPLKAVMLAAGPALRDPEAALDCMCSCHPRPADTGLHDGGTTCGCQLTKSERVAAFNELLQVLHEVSEDEESDADSLQQRADEAATRLGIELDHIGGYAPFVIRGRVDGRGFYLRERHDMWRVVLAPDESPEADPWSADPEMTTITVASGDSDEFTVDGYFDPIVALECAVDAARLFLLRRRCDHATAQRFCPVCGVETAHAARWRIHTDR